ncbi:DUF4350 domain-containing protein [Bacillus sp. P14.5]|uniref:DUF4350 domain-containing protein n=1 Tax=Bacillus sp. P14.5 TaxID=1983400 RepID=UPI000DEB0395|nr:DUF4350 domain-containing protein [Bacillus sp. P14.5]
MAKNKSKLILLAVILLVFAVLSYFIGSRAPKEYPNYLSESPSPTGTKAVFTYLENELGQVEEWTSSPNRLDKEEEGQLLIMVEPFFMPESEETGQYREFMEAGNNILLFKTNPQGMFDIKTIAGGMGAQEITTLNDKQGEKRNALLPAPIRLDTEDEDEVLISDEAGPVALKRPVGEGSLIVATAPQWMTNDLILEEDHLPLVMSLINESSSEAVLFDEYIHGEENDSSIVTIYPQWFLLLMVQGVLLAILWLWYQGKRFGPVVQVREEYVRFSDERIKALAAWNLRGKRFTDSLNIQADYVKLLLQEKWGIAYSRDWVDSTERMARKWASADEKEITSFAAGLSAALKKETLSKQEYLLWSKKLDRLRKEVEEG